MKEQHPGDGRRCLGWREQNVRPKSANIINASHLVMYFGEDRTTKSCSAVGRQRGRKFLEDCTTKCCATQRFHQTKLSCSLTKGLSCTSIWQECKETNSCVRKSIALP